MENLKRNAERMSEFALLKYVRVHDFWSKMENSNGYLTWFMRFSTHTERNTLNICQSKNILDGSCREKLKTNFFSNSVFNEFRFFLDS